MLVIKYRDCSHKSEKQRENSVAESEKCFLKWFIIEKFKRDSLPLLSRKQPNYLLII